MSEKISRKNVLLLPSYQIRLVGFFVLMLFIGSIIHGFFLYFITSRAVEDGFLSAHNRLRSTWEILKPAIILTNGVSFLLLSLAFLTIGIFISHRLIGPIFKISGRLREMSQGKLRQTPLKLRDGDEGQILCDSVNQLQGSWRERFQKLVALNLRLKKGERLTEEEIKATLQTSLQDVELDE